MAARNATAPVRSLRTRVVRTLAGADSGQSYLPSPADLQGRSWLSVRRTEQAMTVEIRESSTIIGVKTVPLTVFRDERGAFQETFRKEWFPEREWNAVQHNRSESRKGVLRGLHFHQHQVETHSQLGIPPGAMHRVLGAGRVQGLLEPGARVRSQSESRARPSVVLRISPRWRLDHVGPGT